MAPSALLLCACIDLGFTLLLTAVALEVITGWNIQWVIVGIASFTILYTLMGGIEAVVWNDVVQGLVLAGGAVTILCTLLFRPEGGPEQCSPPPMTQASSVWETTP